MVSKAAMFSLISMNTFKVSQKNVQVPLPHCGLFYFFLGPSTSVSHTAQGRQRTDKIFHIHPIHGKTF